MRKRLLDRITIAGKVQACSFCKQERACNWEGLCEECREERKRKAGAK